MAKIEILSLFHCSSIEHKVIEKNVDYLITDYFDGVQIETLDPEKTTLEECMGIQREANSKDGISYQRYCLYLPEDSDKDIFAKDMGYPLLTMIQVFLNPDIYQADCFEDDKKEICCDNCMKRLKKNIEEAFGNSENLKWEFFRLLTAGDFAVVVRSANFHDACSISTFIRSIGLFTEQSSIVGTAFFTYTISGAMCKSSNGDICVDIPWSACLKEEDLVALKISCSHITDIGNVIPENAGLKPRMLSGNYHLSGRYEYQIEYTPEQFEQLYGHIRNYKLGRLDITEKDIGQYSDNKVKVLLWMLKENEISQISEVMLLRSETNDIMSNSLPCVWKLCTAHVWMSIYDYNLKKIRIVKDLAEKIEQNFIRLNIYQSARNLKDYIRLLRRLCRVVYEINQMRELRISASILLQQLKVLEQSMLEYLENAEKTDCNWREIANCSVEYLRQGIGALEIFTRYIRNVNLQTLQTPNFDLQTNVCIEKILTGYSQFMRPFLSGDINHEKHPYYLSRNIYPIVVPNMSAMDMSAIVLFDDTVRAGKEKLMVVNSPTFSYICETCFMIPAIFHEIAHQFRYEERQKRNKCLEAYILKLLLFGIMRKILVDDELPLQDEKMFKEMVDKAFSIIKGRIIREENYDNRLDYYKFDLTDSIQKFLNSNIDIDRYPAKILERYIERTKNNIRVYNNEVLTYITNLKSNAEKLQEICSEDDWENFWENLLALRDLQHRQILNDMTNLLNKSIWNKHKYSLNIEPSDSDIEKLEKIFSLMNSIDRSDFTELDIRELEDLVKQYHNVYSVYSTEFDSRPSIDDLNEFIYNQQIFIDMCDVLYEKTIEAFTKFDKEREEKLNLDATAIVSDRWEHLKQRIKIEQKKGFNDSVRQIFSDFQASIPHFVNHLIMRYREITSDLFMCAMLDLNSLGYLVIAAETLLINNTAQYYRVSLVLQCLSPARRESELDSDDFDKELMCVLREEMTILQNAYIIKTSSEVQMNKASIDDIINYLDQLRQVSGLTSTQAWIIRILSQAAHIVNNITGTIVANDEIGMQDIWKDLINEHSYIENREKIQDIMNKNVDKILCKSVSQILNSPASFFERKKSITIEEIDFILQNYEDSCKWIFDTILKEDRYGHSSV